MSAVAQIRSSFDHSPSPRVSLRSGLNIINKCTGVEGVGLSMRAQIRKGYTRGAVTFWPRLPFLPETIWWWGQGMQEKALLLKTRTVGAEAGTLDAVSTSTGNIQGRGGGVV